MTAAPNLVTEALGYLTAPYARGAATLALVLDSRPGGSCNVRRYDFTAFQRRFGLADRDLDVSYLLVLLISLGDEPRTVEVDWSGPQGAGTARVLVPAGSLPGASFALPLTRGQGVALLERLRERPAPQPGEPAGPAKWRLVALLGNTARLAYLLMAERQALAALGDDVAAQHLLQDARDTSLDRIGAALRVLRLLPAPYRLDLDTGTVALWHLDDMVAPVLDSTGEHPGSSHGAERGVAGRFGGAAMITPAGGITIPDAAAFAIEAAADFTVELQVQLPPPPHEPQAGTLVLAVKRSRTDRDDTAGWLLGIDQAADGSRSVAFVMTDRAGSVVRAASGPLPLPAAWFHVAGVLDRNGGRAIVYLDGQVVVSVPLGTLGTVANCADIGLGADSSGAARFDGTLDEVRLSSVARSDFTAMTGPGAAPYQADADTIALYHLDETDDWVEDDSGHHHAVNHGAERGVPARFNAGLRFAGDPLPPPRCDSEREFQRRLRTGTWDPAAPAAGPPVTAGPYTRYGYRQGAISLPGLDGQPAPVLVNDDPGVAGGIRGQVTTACYGFSPSDLDQTISALQAAGRTAQEAIDYYGDWHGEPESFYQQQYASHGISAPHESCPSTPYTPTCVLVPADPELAFGADVSFTVEAIIKPDPVDDDYPRAFIASRSSGLRDTGPLAHQGDGEGGFGLTIGDYNCISGNLCFTVGDATGNLVAVTAGFSLADGAFHHVAGVVDRDVGVALLLVDGTEAGRAPLGQLDAVSAAGDLFFGNDPALDAPYAGLLDEVRLSAAPRRVFHPVLGESDDRYRQRLAIYQPWRLPTVDELRRGVTALSLAGATAEAATALLLSHGPASAGQLDLIEAPSTRTCASRILLVAPVRLADGQSIAADGTTPADAETAAGPAHFHLEALLRHDDAPGLQFGGELARWMTLSAALALEALAARLSQLSPVNTPVISVAAAYDPEGDLVHAQGRALDLTLAAPDPRLDIGMLGALAHILGVAWVRVGYPSEGAVVHLAVAAGPELDVAGPDIAPLGQAVRLTVARPTIASPDTLQWHLLRCGTGDAVLTPLLDGSASCDLVGAGPGEVTVHVSYPLPEGATLLGARRITVAPATLDGCATIAADGRTGIGEIAAAGPPEGDFNPGYLVRSSDPRLDYASDAARHMQLPLETALLRLADLASAEPGSPRVTIAAAYDPNAATLQAVGRGALLIPSSAALSAGRLGALAFLADFDFVERRRYPPSAYVAVRAGDRFELICAQPTRLWQHAGISGLGELMPGELAAAGPPDPGFQASMLAPYTGAGVTFAAGASNQVQPVLATALDALVAALGADGVTGQVTILAGFNPAARGLAAVGRAVLMQHSAVAAERLAGYALAAGFGYVEHRLDPAAGASVYAAAYAAGAAPLAILGGDAVPLGGLAELRLHPAPPPSGRLDWCLKTCGPAAAVLSTALPDSATSPGNGDKILRGTAAGTLTTTATFAPGNGGLHAEPYQVMLVPHASTPEPRLTKDQYDDLLNLVDAYHPLGVEVVTRPIRRYVHGFRRPRRWDDLPAAATYPPYRSDR